MELLKKPLLLLDGAMGTILSRLLPTKLSNLDEATVLYPKIVEEVHRAYAEAGADIIKTNTFNNSPFTKEAVALIPRSKLIAGVIGPVFYETKLEKIIENFNEAGAHIILLETMTSLNETKEHLEILAKNTKLPIMVSITIDQNGNALSGESPSIFLKEISHFKFFSFGFNCSFGPGVISKALCELENPSGVPISAHPNLGVPEISEESFLEEIESWIRNKQVSIIGGCCGTTPEIIKKIRALIP